MPGDAAAAKETLSAFLRRADRIMSTAAAQRQDLATLGSTLKVIIRVGQPYQNIERTYLPEQELLHAAVIVRPVVLQDEPVHLGRVLSAISLLVQDAPETVRANVKAIRKAWSKTLTSERWIVAAADTTGRESGRLTNVDIAELWFNAYAWHDDQDKQRSLQLISEDECLIAATVWVSDRVLVVRGVQQLIADLRQGGHLQV